jgi:hypothetical protein
MYKVYEKLYISFLIIKINVTCCKNMWIPFQTYEMEYKLKWAG